MPRCKYYSSDEHPDDYSSDSSYEEPKQCECKRCSKKEKRCQCKKCCKKEKKDKKEVCEKPCDNVVEHKYNVVSKPFSYDKQCLPINCSKSEKTIYIVM